MEGPARRWIVSLFSAVIKVVVETTKIPLAVAKDAIAFGYYPLFEGWSHTGEQLERIKKASEG